MYFIMGKPIAFLYYNFLIRQFLPAINESLKLNYKKRKGTLSKHYALVLVNKAECVLIINISG
jgi:hypothetical protein